MQTKTPTVEALPKRRGVVMRAGGISDSYGTTYQRQPSGALVRTKAKRRRSAGQDWLESVEL
jgi:hypothetical protein